MAMVSFGVRMVPPPSKQSKSRSRPMAVIGADLARLPAGDRNVAFSDLAKDLLDVLPGIPRLFLA